MNSHFFLPGRFIKSIRSVFLLSMILGSMGCTASQAAKEEVESGKPDTSVIKQQTVQIPSFEDALHLQDQPYLLYITKDDCYFCDMLEPVVAHYIRNYNTIPLYILPAQDDIESSLSACDATSKTCIKGTPGLLKIDGGEIVWSVDGVDSINTKLKEIAHVQE